MVPAPSQAELRQGLSLARAGRGGPTALPMHAFALTFSRRAGVEPDLDSLPDLERALLFGPLSPASFRLQGPDSQAEAAARVRSAASAFGGEAENRYRPDEAGLRDLLRGSGTGAAA